MIFKLRSPFRYLRQLLGGRYKLAFSAAFWDAHEAADEEHVYWLAVPEVVRWVNRKVSGHPEIWHLSWFLLSLEGEVPVRRALSIGCGAGNLEREVIRHGSAQHVDAIDISELSVERAKEAAAEQGYSERISYHVADAVSWLKAAAAGPGYDLVFFHASLHHVENLEEVLGLTAACLRGAPGLLYIDEYVGPSRDRWTREQLGYASSMYGRIPRPYRRSDFLAPPVAFDDPTEMIRSAEIVDVLRGYFEILEYKPYYGNVVMPLVCGIPHRAIEQPAVSEVIGKAMELEDFLIEKSLLDPLYAVVVAKPRR